MNIIGIIGSPRRNGSTATLVRDALRGARENGAETEEIFLPDCRIEYCKGCFTCMAKGRCPIDDDFEEIREKVYGADGVIIGSPSYGIAPTAIYKTFLDRIGMFTVYTSSMGGKYIAGISTSAAMGASQVSRQLTGLADGVFKRGYVSGRLAVNVGWDGVGQDHAARKKAYALGRKVSGDIAAGPRYPFQGILKRMLHRVVLKRVFRNNVLQNKETRMRAVYENLAARDLI